MLTQSHNSYSRVHDSKTLTIFTFAVFVTSFAQVAKNRVFLDCSTCVRAGLIVHMIAVLAFPPKESCKIRVSFESLQGMCPLRFSELQWKFTIKFLLQIKMYICCQNFLFKPRNNAWLSSSEFECLRFQQLYALRISKIQNFFLQPGIWMYSSVMQNIKNI